jgi:hypothetical protein
MGKRSNDDRFWQQVVKYPFVTCWLWKGGKHKGYGVFYCDGRKVAAHRYAWERRRGPIPNGMMLLHSCDIRCCVNVAHLRLGTAQDNTNDTVRQKRHVYGERRWNAVLTADDVRFIRQSHETTSSLARRYGVTPSAISQTRSGKNWKCVEL